MIDHFIYSVRFIKALKKSSAETISIAKEKIQIFKNNTKDPSLKIHKLNGRLGDKWAFSVNYKIRIIIEFYKNAVIFLDIGDHDLYR